MTMTNIKIKASMHYLKTVLDQNPEFIPSLILFCIGTIFKFLNLSFSYVFFVLSVLVCGFNVFVSGLRSATKLKFSEKTLITIASVGSVIINESFEAFLILVFFRIGESLEKIAKSKSKEDINKISKILPDTAHLFSNGTEKEITATKLNPGDIFIVYPFEKIPCDGTIIEGKTYLNLNAITGESMPVLADVGSKVLSGSINTNSTIKIKTEKYKPLLIKVAFHPKKNIFYKCRYKITTSTGNSIDFILKGFGSYLEEHIVEDNKYTEYKRCNFKFDS